MPMRLYQTSVHVYVQTLGILEMHDKPVLGNGCSRCLDDRSKCFGVVGIDDMNIYTPCHVK